MKNEKKCFCQAALQKDGTCRWKCDPALKAPARRRKLSEIQAREAARVEAQPMLSAEEARRGVARVLPIRLQRLSADQSRRSRRMHREAGHRYNPAPGAY